MNNPYVLESEFDLVEIHDVYELQDLISEEIDDGWIEDLIDDTASDCKCHWKKFFQWSWLIRNADPTFYDQIRIEEIEIRAEETWYDLSNSEIGDTVWTATRAWTVINTPNPEKEVEP